MEHQIGQSLRRAQPESCPTETLDYLCESQTEVSRISRPDFSSRRLSPLETTYRTHGC
jgi:hypothetical protein